jgi:hypothetical protein
MLRNLGPRDYKFRIKQEKDKLRGKLYSGKLQSGKSGTGFFLRI